MQSMNHADYMHYSEYVLGRVVKEVCRERTFQSMNCAEYVLCSMEYVVWSMDYGVWSMQSLSNFISHFITIKNINQTITFSTIKSLQAL